MSTQREDGIFRDFTPGMEGRRDDLLRKRRAELATMPHALRRIYVARLGRVAAAAAACMGGAVLVGAAVDPGYQGMLADLLPGKEPAVLSSLLLGTLVVSALAYLLGRCVAEARFTRAMSHCVLPDDDVASDVERLSHVRPDQVASTMIQRFESPAAVLPPAAIALAAPCALAYVLMAARAGGYPKEALVDAAFTGYGTTLATIGCAGLTAALFLGFSRKRHDVGYATRTAGVLATAVTALGVLWASASGYAWVGLTMTVLALLGSVALVQRERRIVLLDETGELWTVGSLLASAWSLAQRVRAQLTVANLRRLPGFAVATLRRRRVRRIAGAAALAAAALVYLMAPAATKSVSMAVPSLSPSASADGSSAALANGTHTPTSYLSHATVTGDMPVQLDGSGSVILVGAHGEGLAVPAGWSAQVNVFITGDVNGLRTRLHVGDEIHALSPTSLPWTRIEAADHERTISLELFTGSVQGEVARSVTLHYQVMLSPSAGAPAAE